MRYCESLGAAETFDSKKMLTTRVSIYKKGNVSTNAQPSKLCIQSIAPLYACQEKFRQIYPTKPFIFFNKLQNVTIYVTYTNYRSKDARPIP